MFFKNEKSERCSNLEMFTNESSLQNIFLKMKSSHRLNVEKRPIALLLGSIEFFNKLCSESLV